MTRRRRTWTMGRHKRMLPSLNEYDLETKNPSVSSNYLNNLVQLSLATSSSHRHDGLSPRW